jgi:hypothetical protein
MCGRFTRPHKYSAIRICGCAFLSSAVALADDVAPPALRGKSAIIAWREERVQRQVGEANFHDVTGDLNLSLYFSSQGHVFARLTPTVGGRSAPMERRFGDENIHWVVNFNGTSMTFFDPFVSGGVRRVNVNFHSHFESCTANAVFGKKSDTAIIMWSPISKAQNEVLSIKPGPLSCSVREGNIFEAQ